MAGSALVTGGAGFIGSQLSELLLDEGWEVFALDDLSTGEVYGQGIEEMFQRIPSIEKIRTAIGWEPGMALDEILEVVVASTRADTLVGG